MSTPSSRASGGQPVLGRADPLAADLDHLAVADVVVQHPAAHPLAGLEHHDRGPARHERPSGAEPRQPRPHHHDVGVVCAWLRQAGWTLPARLLPLCAGCSDEANPKTVTLCASLAALGTVVPAAPAAAKTYVPCSKGGGVSLSLKAKPRKCDFTDMHNPLALAGRAVSLDWKGWGRRVARARGTGVGIHADENGNFNRFPVRVKLSRRVSCGGRRIYTRVTMVDQDDRRIWSVPPLRC